MKNVIETVKNSFSDEKNHGKLKSQIQKYLAEGKTKLIWLENQITDKKNQKKLKEGFEKSKDQLVELKKKFVEFEEKAVHYTEKNPKKALAIAGAAGLLVGTLWTSFQKKAPAAVPKKPKQIKSKK